MTHKLKIVFPVGIFCLAVLVFCMFALKSNAVSAGDKGGDASAAAVTYNADAWSESKIAVPAVAQETSAELNTEKQGAGAEDGSDAAETDEKHYALTDADRAIVERIVMCEAGGEGTKGQMMVAQCIKEGLIRYQYSMDEYIENYKVHLTSYSNVTDEVRASVSRVFDDDERVIEEKADLWYNPAITPSEWHEEQQYVTTIGSHRFFWMEDSSQT